MATTESEIEYVAIVRNASALIGSWARVFAAAALAAFTGIVAARVADGQDPFAIDWTIAQGILAAGLFAVAPVIRNWLTPSDPRYGLVSTPDDDASTDDEDTEDTVPAVVGSASLSVETEIAEPLAPEETWYDDEDRASRKPARSRSSRATTRPAAPKSRTRIGFTS